MHLIQLSPSHTFCALPHWNHLHNVTVSGNQNRLGGWEALTDGRRLLGARPAAGERGGMNTLIDKKYKNIYSFHIISPTLEVAQVVEIFIVEARQGHYALHSQYCCYDDMGLQGASYFMPPYRTTPGLFKFFIIEFGTKKAAYPGESERQAEAPHWLPAPCPDHSGPAATRQEVSPRLTLFTTLQACPPFGDQQ